MLSNSTYKQELIDLIKHAPDECFEAPAGVARAMFLDDESTLNTAATCLQADYENNVCDYDSALEDALKEIGLKHIELIIGKENIVSEVSTKPSKKYIAVIAPEYVRNVEVFDSDYNEEDIGDYIYDDQRWQAAYDAEIFIGVFQAADCDDEAMQKIKEDAVSTAINNGLCEGLSLDAVKLIEV